MKNEVETGKLSGMLESIKEDDRKAFLKDVNEAVAASKEARGKLGAHLKAMRDALKKAKKWYEVIEEVSLLTGYASRTILRWTKPEVEASSKKTTKKDFDRLAETRSLVNRLKANKCADSKAVADFALRVIELEAIADDASGDEECVKFLNDVIAEVVSRRKMPKLKVVRNG